MKTCIYCFKTVEEDDEFCSHCGGPLIRNGGVENNNPYSSEQTNAEQYSSNNKVNHIIVTVGILVFIALIVWISNPKTKKIEVTKEPVKKVETSSIERGDTIFITGSPIAVTKKDFNEMVDMLMAGDKLGFAKMGMEGRLLFIGDNTKALVLEAPFEMFRVRILDGEFIGSDGWVSDAFCRK